MINFNPIADELFVGTYPQNTLDVDRLKSGPRITAIINLQTDSDMRSLAVDWAQLERYYMTQDLVLRRWPIRDFDPEDLTVRLSGAVELLHQLLAVGHRAYVHCTAGVGRAPAVVIAHLAWYQGWDLEQAYEHVRAHRDCDPYLDAIRVAQAQRAADL